MLASSSEFTVRDRADAGHSCIIIQIVRPEDTLVAHYAQAVSTANPHLSQTPTECDIPNFVLVDAHLGSLLVQNSKV